MRLYEQSYGPSYSEWWRERTPTSSHGIIQSKASSPPKDIKIGQPVVYQSSDGVIYSGIAEQVRFRTTPQGVTIRPTDRRVKMKKEFVPFSSVCQVTEDMILGKVPTSELVKRLGVHDNVSDLFVRQLVHVTTNYRVPRKSTH